MTRLDVSLVKGSVAKTSLREESIGGCSVTDHTRGQKGQGVGGERGSGAGAMSAEAVAGAGAPGSPGAAPGGSPFAPEKEICSEQIRVRGLPPPPPPPPPPPLHPPRT